MIQATVTSPNSQTNAATITHADQFDPVTTNNTTSVDTTPQQSDLALAKSVSDATPNVGDTISYTVTLTNSGPDAATGVQVTDLLPAGVAFVSAAPSQGTYNPANGLWTVGSVGTTSQTLIIQAIVTSPNPQTNAATITHADQFDPDTANNTASATQTPQLADLALAKSVNNAAPNVGETITYTVTLSNEGPDAATAVQVTDLLPVGVMFVSAAPSQGTYNSVSGLWAVGTVTTAAPQTLTLTATVVDAGQVINTATITHADQFDPDPSNNTASAPEVAEEADLALSKSVSDPAPNVGDTVTYTVTLRNIGPNPATGVQVRDELPLGVLFVSGLPSQGTYDSTTGLWTVGTVTTTAPPLTLRLTVIVGSPHSQTNTATIGHSDQYDPNPSNNTASSILTPQQANLVLAKAVSDPTPNVGDIVTYTMTLTNNGPDTATNVRTADRLPAGLSFVSAAPSQGAYDPASGTWIVGTVTTSSPQTLMIRAKVVSPTPGANIATITHSDQFETSPSDNTDGVALLPQQADLALAKAVSNARPNVGDTIAYTVRLANIGPNAATNVRVTDVLPAGLSFLADTPSQGIYSPTTGIWSVGTVNLGVPEILVIFARVISPVAQINTATITHSDQFDPAPGNNSASAVVTPPVSDLVVAKEASDPSPLVGETLYFVVAVANRGPAAAVGVAVADALPPGLAFVSSTPSVGAYNPATGIWWVGGLADGATATLAVVARATAPGVATNTAIVAGAEFDPNPANNVASAAVTVRTPTPPVSDLVVAKEASDPSPLVGETLYFVVAVANRGPAAAVGVAVADALPPGLAFVSSTPSVGAYNPATGIWWVGGLADGATATLAVVARATAPGVATNTAIVAGAEFDPNPANNVASAAVTVRTPAPPEVISLARYGFHTQPTSLVLGFNTPLVAAAAQNVANYQIVQIGAGGSISAPIPIVSAIYDPATDTVTLNPSRQLYLYGHYVLTVNGMAPYGLISTTGIRLGGTSVGGPGANYVRVFGPEILAGPNPTGATPAVAGFRAKTSASAAAIRSSAAPRSPSLAPPVPATTASRGYGGMPASAVDKVLESFRKPRRRWT